MKGLILNNIKFSMQNVKTLIPVVLMIFIIGTFVLQEYLYTVVCFLPIFLFPTMYIQSYQLDYSSNWNKLELCMPLKRKNIVLSKYVTYLLFLAVGILFTVIYMLINFLINDIAIEKFVVAGLMLMISSTIFSAILLYPLSIKFNFGNYEALSLCTFMFSFVPLYIAATIASKIMGLENVFAVNNSLIFWLIYMIITILLFIASYFYSSKLYENKDF